MKLATLRTETGNSAVVITDDSAIEIDEVADVGALLGNPEWRAVAEAADGKVHALDSIEDAAWAPVVPQPSKIICAGLNYRKHILEMGRELPEYPTFFAKYPEALIGAFDEIELSPLSNAVDWEAELAVVIGKPVRNATEAEAEEAIAGYAVLNDVTMRDFQYRTLQWLQGKTFENTTPFGPYLVTTDEWTPGPTMKAVVDGDTVQEVSTGELVFSPAALISYFSQVVTLNPGDVIATGTPGGVGHARKPQRYLQNGSVLQTSIEGVGAQRNVAGLAG
ncbi:fumarylacetoacetate hydrolase family protein [Glaciibacter superstes]|uniref:fumarylacetoacetate hydrolase family protein n=1 Tax=Glaciibacter superstes TaxID=501023 RepID=UPI0003B760EC|nr:fumarylacetoacetate hydrolase family protein [Glaciibacter superstes]